MHVNSRPTVAYSGLNKKTGLHFPKTVYYGLLVIREVKPWFSVINYKRFILLIGRGGIYPVHGFAGFQIIE